MHSLRIQIEGLTVKEVIDLGKLVAGFDGVADVKFCPVEPGTLVTRSFPSPQLGVGILHLIVKLFDGAVMSIGAVGVQHVYKKVGESVIDKVWETVSAKLTGNSSTEVAVTLYGADGEVIKQHKGKR